MTPTPSLVETAFVRQIEETIGAEHVIDEPAACAAFAVHGVVPQLVAAPGSVAELAQVIAAASAVGARIAPWGGGTKQAIGRPPERLDLVVQTARLAAVAQYEPDDLTISVQAGMSMAALSDTVGAHGQMLPVDVALPTRATIGGVLATAADGPRRSGYGTLRDLLIGIQVVEATGRISKAGGMVVKNVSGFDMMKLYLGSYGTLAVIASANFKLLPRPRAAATILCSFAHRADAFALADALHAGQLSPVAVEYLVGQRESPALTAHDTHVMAVWAEGLPPAVARQCRDVATLARNSGATHVETLEGEDHIALWECIADMPQTRTVAANELVLRLSCLPSDVGRALGEAAELAQRHRLELTCSAHTLAGVAYLRLHGATAALAACQQELLAHWPALVTTTGNQELARQLAVWGCPHNDAGLMQRIKQEFDPHGLLNPGRFLV